MPHSKTSTEKQSRAVVEDKDLLNSFHCKDNVRTRPSEDSELVAAPSVSQSSSVDSDHQHKHEGESEGKVQQHKRPAPVPLPALALFLKQHSTKSKKVKSKSDFPRRALPSNSLLESQCLEATSTRPLSHSVSSKTSLSKAGDVTKSDDFSSGCTAHIHPNETLNNFRGKEVEIAREPSSLLCPGAVATECPKDPRTQDSLDSLSVTESTGLESAVPFGTPGLPNSDQQYCTSTKSVSIISSTLATSSLCPILSPSLDTMLPASTSPRTPTFIELSTLPSDSPTIKSDSLLPNPECSSFGFEPLLPTSSPGPLPTLPTSLTLQLHSTTSEPTPKAVPEELSHREDSAASVFKWHTVLPPPERYIDTSFTTFQPTPQTPPFTPAVTPLLPSQTPVPQTLDTSTSTPSPHPAPSFQDNEQSLPFPGELSPLALQLPLSPTFSSLDGEGLSPTPSLTDLVHFFSNNDDLGIGLEFTNAETLAVSCPPPSAVEASTHEVSQVQPVPAKKHYRRKKKSRRRKLAKAGVDPKIHELAYTSMQPSLEEVEEQLFVSFTSKVLKCCISCL